MKNFPLLSLLVALSFSACQAPSPQSVEMNTQLDSIAYAVGMDIGKFYHTKQQIKLNPELIYAGIKDIVTQDSGKTRFSEDKGVALMDAFSRMMEAKRAATNEINEKLGPLAYAPIIFTSVLTKQRIFQVVEKALEVYENRKRKIATSKLNEIMLQEIENYPPPAVRGKYIKIK